MNSGAPEE